MAALMPNLMLPEVMSLNSYLYHDVSILCKFVEITKQFLGTVFLASQLAHFSSDGHG